MHRTTIHIASFGEVYSFPQQGNVLSGIQIRINNINLTFVIDTLKDLVIPFSNMFAGVAGLGSVSRFYSNQFNTIQSSLVSQKGTQLSKRPTTKFSPKLFVTSFGSKSDIGQILNGNALTLFFSRLYNRLCNSVVDYGSRCSFFAREPFQQLTRVACALSHSFNSFSFNSHVMSAVQPIRKRIDVFNATNTYPVEKLFSFTFVRTIYYIAKFFIHNLFYRIAKFFCSIKGAVFVLISTFKSSVRPRAISIHNPKYKISIKLFWDFWVISNCRFSRYYSKITQVFYHIFTSNIKISKFIFNNYIGTWGNSISNKIQAICIFFFKNYCKLAGMSIVGNTSVSDNHAKTISHFWSKCFKNVISTIRIQSFKSFISSVFCTARIRTKSILTQSRIKFTFTMFAYFYHITNVQNIFEKNNLFALNRTTNLLFLFPIGINPIGRMFNPIRSNDQICQTEVHTDKFLDVINILFGNINGLEKVKLPFLVNQICFTFNVEQISRIVADKLNLLATTNAPQGNDIIGLISHNTTVVSNTTKWSKSAFGFLIQLISIGNFCNSTYQALRRKFKRCPISVVNFVMEFEIIKDAFRPSNVRNSITNGICFLDSFKEQIRLFSSRKKFDFQRQFHNTNVVKFSDIRKIFNFGNAKAGAFLPTTLRDSWVSCTKIL